jgi:hypothetical protein
MMSSLRKLGLFLAGLYAVYYFAFPTYTHRFRLTFQIEENGQVKEGTGVITVSNQDNSWVPLTQTRWTRTARGPSPWIDLGARGILLIAILPHVPYSYDPKPYDAGSLSFVAFFGADQYGNSKITPLNVIDIKKQVGPRTLHDDQYPEFVWLSNPADPSSAKIVPPQLFTEVIGADVRLVSVSVEITTDHSDNSLYQKLPWLAELEKQEFWNPPYQTAKFKLTSRKLLGD